MMPAASAMFVLGTDAADQVYTGDALAILSAPLAHRSLGCIYDASAREATRDSVRAPISRNQTPDRLLSIPAFDDV
jgi:hypothetical protein